MRFAGERMKLEVEEEGVVGGGGSKRKRSRLQLSPTVTHIYIRTGIARPTRELRVLA